MRSKPTLPYGDLIRRRRRQRDDGIQAADRWVKRHCNQFAAPVPFHVDRDFGADRVGFEAGRKILSRQRLIVDIDQQVIAAESGPVGRATGKNRKDPRPPAFGLNRNTQGWASVGGRLRAELEVPLSPESADTGEHQSH